MYQKEKWSQATIQKVWQKAVKVSDENDAAGFRKDACGAWMKFDQHGDRSAKYGWEVDHKKPLALRGSDDLENLQPLRWENNVEKGDSPTLKCAVRN